MQGKGQRHDLLGSSFSPRSFLCFPPHYRLILLMALRCPRESLSACSSDAQVQILRPSLGDVVFDPAPELELSAIIRDDGAEGVTSFASQARMKFCLQITIKLESCSTETMSSSSLYQQDRSNNPFVLNARTLTFNAGATFRIEERTAQRPCAGALIVMSSQHEAENSTDGVQRKGSGKLDVTLYLHDTRRRQRGCGRMAGEFRILCTAKVG